MTLINPSQLAFLGLPGGWEWVVILVIGLLLFGSRLPSIGKNVGKSITEFKKGLKEASAEMNAEDTASTPSAPRQLSQEQIIEQATQEAVRRMKAEQQK